MKTNLPKVLFLTAAFAVSSLLNAQVVTIAAWNFDEQTATPSSGSGTFGLVGGATNPSYNAGATPGQATAIGGAVTSLLYGYQTTTYPAQSTNPKTAGVQIDVSTTGLKNIKFTADIRHSNTSANTKVLQYSTNGTDWNDVTSFVATNGGDKWYLCEYDLTSITAVNNQTTLSFRIVTDYAIGGSTYAAATSTSSYATTGTLRFDNVSITGVDLSTRLSALTSNSFSINGRTLVFEKETESPVKIYNIAGSLVVEAQRGIKTLDLNLNKGIYIVKYENEGRKVVLN